MIYIVQAVTLLYAVCFAVQNQIPVMKMRNNGASITEERQFHGANAVLTAIYLVVATCVLRGVWYQGIAHFIMLSLIYYVAFDIALNRLTDKPWDYVGNTAQSDRLVRQYLGKHPGRNKALICLVLIILLNLLR